MTKKELINKIHHELKGSATKAQVIQIVNLVFDEISKTLQRHEKVKIFEFGTFEVTKRKERIGINPDLYQQLIKDGFSPELAKEKAKINISSTCNILFRAAENLKKLL